MADDSERERHVERLAAGMCRHHHGHRWTSGALHPGELEMRPCKLCVLEARAVMPVVNSIAQAAYERGKAEGIDGERALFAAVADRQRAKAPGFRP